MIANPHPSQPHILHRCLAALPTARLFRLSLSLSLLLPLFLPHTLSRAAVPLNDLTIQTITLTTNQEATLNFTLPPAEPFHIQVSDDLVSWRNLYTLAPGETQFTDTSTPFLSDRYYRLSSTDSPTALSGDHFQTTLGDAIIRPVNHASFVIQWNGLMIYNDPVGAASLYSSFPKADLILVSHTHGDHYNNTTLAAILKPTGIIVAPAAVWSSLTAALRSQAFSMSNGQSTNFATLKLSVDAVPAYNANHPKGVGNGYVLNLGGKRFYMSGDTEDVAEMRALKNIDAAFLCMNTPFTMTVAKAASAVRDFKPGVVFPYHYRNSDGTFADLNLLKRTVGSTTNKVEVRPRKWY